jgi:hypothetical protein
VTNVQVNVLHEQMCHVHFSLFHVDADVSFFIYKMKMHMSRFKEEMKMQMSNCMSREDAGVIFFSINMQICSLKTSR